MNDEIKEILHLLKRCDNTYLKIENSNGEKEYEYHQVNDLRLDGYHSQLLLDYITNLQEENERLKTKLNCKEYFSATMPEDTEFVILTKENYDRQEKDIQLELIDYKSRCEKATELIEKSRVKATSFFKQFDGDLLKPKREVDKLLNLLNGGDEE